MNDQKRLQDMLDAALAIESFGIQDYESFMADEKTQDAVMFNLIIMGESANQISNSMQDRFHSIPWSAIIGTRNVIVHGYDQVKLQVVWGIIQNDLGDLTKAIRKALEEM